MATGAIRFAEGSRRKGRFRGPIEVSLSIMHL